MKELRLLIAVPSQQDWNADFGMSLIFLLNHIAAHAKIGDRVVTFRLHNKRGSILAKMREELIKTAIENDCHYVLFLDSDQTFPRDTFHRLYAHKKQIVACNIATKMLPPTPTARLKGGVHGVPLYTREHDTDLVPVWRVGTGIMLINLNVFKRAHMEQPWFDQHWNPSMEDYTGEDWAFCEKLEHAGVTLYVDQDLSRQIGHVGKLEYRHDMILEAQEQQEESA